MQSFDVERQGQRYLAAGAPPSAYRYPPQSIPNTDYATAKPNTYGYEPYGSDQQLATPCHLQQGYGLPPAQAAGLGHPAVPVFPGYPAAAYPAAAVAHNGQQTSVMIVPGGIDYNQIGNEPCACSAGWVLFGVGWIFPICWLVGACLPWCSKNRNDRRAAIGSSVMLSLTVVVIILCIVLPLTYAARASNDNSVYHDASLYNSNYWDHKTCHKSGGCD